MSSNTDVVTSSSTERLIGRVKWFNNKAGYGFITVTDGSRSGSDIFIHHSAIEVENQQYKYLVQGEYVDFSLIKTTSSNHEWQASSVKGIRGGKLMCETRRDLKLSRTAYKVSEQESQEETQPTVAAPTQKRRPRDSTKKTQPRLRGEGPRDSEKGEWSVVNNKNTDNTLEKDKTPSVRKPYTRKVATVESK